MLFYLARALLQVLLPKYNGIYFTSIQRKNFNRRKQCVDRRTVTLWLKRRKFVFNENTARYFRHETYW